MADQEMSIEERTARLIADGLPDMVRMIHRMSARPYGVVKLTPDRELWAFGFHDDTVDVEQLRAQGLPEAEIADHYFPLRPKLREQAGLAFDEQRAYTDKLAERYLRAQETGRFIKPPDRPE